MRLDMGTPSFDAEMMWDNLNLDFFLLFHYQILGRWSADLIIGSPSFTLNASKNSGMFERGPLTRNLPGACGFVLTSCFRAASLYFPRHTCAHPRKKR